MFSYNQLVGVVVLVKLNVSVSRCLERFMQCGLNIDRMILNSVRVLFLVRLGMLNVRVRIVQCCCVWFLFILFVDWVFVVLCVDCFVYVGDYCFVCWGVEYVGDLVGQVYIVLFDIVVGGDCWGVQVQV